MGAKLNTASSGWVDLNALAEAVWTHTIRSLTESAGLTIEEHDKLLSLENSTGGGGGFSSQAIQTSISNAKRAIIEKIEEIKPTDLTGIETQLDEIDSHITLAFDDTIDTIKETEIEVCSDIVRVKTELKKDNVATRQLVRQKTNKIDENVSKLSDRQDLTDKMIEDEANEIEKALEQVDDEEITKAIEQADTEHEKNIIEALNNL